MGCGGLATCTVMSIADINALVATTTTNTYSYLNGILPQLLVFAVVIGMVFFAIRWVWSLIRGHGHRP